MFPQTPSCASSHYFFNMSVHLFVNQLSISLSYFYLKKLVTTSPPKPPKGLSLYNQGMFPQTPYCGSSHYENSVLSNSSKFCAFVRSSVCLSFIIQACEHICS